MSVSLRNGKTNIFFYFHVNNSINKSKLRLFAKENINIWSVFEKHVLFGGYNNIGCVLEKIYLTPEWYITVCLVFLSNFTAVPVHAGTRVIYLID